MAAINRAQIPASALVSQEALLAYAYSLCDEIFRGQPEVREAINVTSDIFSTGVFTDLDGFSRYSGRFNLKIQPTWVVNGGSIWSNIIQTANIATPPAWIGS